MHLNVFMYETGHPIYSSFGITSLCLLWSYDIRIQVMLFLLGQNISKDKFFFGDCLSILAQVISWCNMEDMS